MNKFEVNCDFVDGCVVIVFIVVVGFIVVVVDVTGTVILIGDAAKLLTVVEFVFRNTAATITFVVIFGGFVFAISILGEVAGDVPVLAEDALIGDIARKKIFHCCNPSGCLQNWNYAGCCCWNGRRCSICC